MAYPQRTNKGGLLNKLFAFFNFTVNPQYVSLLQPLRVYICMATSSIRSSGVSNTINVTTFYGPKDAEVS